MNQDPKQIAMRYRAMFGTGWQGKLAACMGVQKSAVTRQVRGHTSLQHWFAAYIEFFEVTPRALWPERWAVLREAADRSSPLMAETDQLSSVVQAYADGVGKFPPPLRASTSIVMDGFNANRGGIESTLRDRFKSAQRNPSPPNGGN